MAQAAQATETGDPIEEEVEAAIAMCRGDARAAVRGLILGQRQLQERISAGYERRGLH